MGSFLRPHPCGRDRGTPRTAQTQQGVPPRPASCPPGKPLKHADLMMPTEGSVLSGHRVKGKAWVTPRGPVAAPGDAPRGVPSRDLPGRSADQDAHPAGTHPKDEPARIGMVITGRDAPRRAPPGATGRVHTGGCTPGQSAPCQHPGGTSGEARYPSERLRGRGVTSRRTRSAGTVSSRI
jgi:hypothetical protein